jgi:hypothetical protein
MRNSNGINTWGTWLDYAKGSSGKVITSYKCGMMDECRFYFAQNNVRGVCNMNTMNWAILVFVGLIICSGHNTSGN